MAIPRQTRDIKDTESLLSVLIDMDPFSIADLKSIATGVIYNLLFQRLLVAANAIVDMHA